ncbi:MAG: hypothetical protein WAP35_06840 [Solirubrobacterales bacterium]
MPQIAGRRSVFRRIALIAVGAVLLSTAVVDAKDSHAPKEARDRWLPCEDWVMYHWVPFNQRRLYAATGISENELLRWIRDDDRHTVGQLVRRSGKDVDAVVADLVKPWEGAVSAAHLTELRRRTNEVMTQGHLAQHLLFHRFHTPALALNARRIFNVRGPDYQVARLRGFNPREIGKRGGRSAGQVVYAAMKTLRRYADRGVRGRHMTRKQANYFLRAQRRNLDRWLGQDIIRIRKNEFPRGRKAIRGTRDKVACRYFAGKGHVAGEHESTGRDRH